VTNVRWPNISADLEKRFTEVVEAAAPGTGILLSYERFAASLSTAEREQKSMAELKNDPPAIIFSKDPAALLLFDGEPRFKDIENSPQRARAEHPVRRRPREEVEDLLPHERRALVHGRRSDGSVEGPQPRKR
jgi:hypothetical protein